MIKIKTKTYLLPRDLQRRLDRAIAKPKAVVCPVCKGRGQVMADFYSFKLNTKAANFTLKCRSCFGCGYIII